MGFVGSVTSGWACSRSQHGCYIDCWWWCWCLCYCCWCCWMLLRHVDVCYCLSTVQLQYNWFACALHGKLRVYNFTEEKKTAATRTKDESSTLGVMLVTSCFAPSRCMLFVGFWFSIGKLSTVASPLASPLASHLYSILHKPMLWNMQNPKIKTKGTRIASFWGKLWIICELTFT